MKKLLLLAAIAGFSVSSYGCAQPAQPVGTPPAPEAKDKPADAPAPSETPTTPAPDAAAPAEGKTP